MKILFKRSVTPGRRPTAGEIDLGEPFINIADNVLCLKRADNTVAEFPLSGIVGPQGEQGPQGLQGAAGPQGPQGPQGPMGATGPQGLPGSAGAQGAQGPAGSAGAQGLQGPAGPQGPQGATGATGATGPQGPAGSVEIYQGTGAADTVFPVGHTVLTNPISSTGYAMNATLVVKYNNGGYEAPGSFGTALTGTWRCRGRISGSSYAYLMQRVA